jgi:hypothetical protein
MKNVAGIFQNKVRWFMLQLGETYVEAMNLGLLYWKSDMQTVLATIQSNDPATVNSKLTKANIISAVSMLEAYEKLCTGSTANQSDYMTVAVGILNGTTARTTVLSSATEAFGDRLVTLLNKLLLMANLSNDILSFYFANQIDHVLVVLDDYRPLLGATAAAQQFSEALVAIEQFKKMAFGEVYTTGNFYTISQEWATFDEVQESC